MPVDDTPVTQMYSPPSGSWGHLLGGGFWRDPMITFAHWYFVAGAFSLGLFALSQARSSERPKTVARD